MYIAINNPDFEFLDLQSELAVLWTERRWPRPRWYQK